jgi:integrase
MEADIAGIFAALTATGVKPTPEIVKERYAALSGRKQAERPADLFAAYDQFIERNGFRPSTKTNHRKAKNHLTKFAKTYTLRLTFDRLDRLFWERFGAYLLTVEQMTNDSAWNVLKSIRAFLNDAVERGLTTTEDFRKVTRKSLPKGETSDKPYLTFEELERVRNLDLTDDARLDRVRDLFVFLCYTGVRFGDSQQLRPENIDGDMIRLTLEKNRKAVTVPLLDPARKILDKYERTLPRISNQKANDYLKEVLRKAEINTKCQVVRHSGTERREVIASKYELCGMHTAKRTYVSLLRQRGVSVEALMKATGNSRATLERYILRTDAEALEEIREAWA